MGSYHIHLFRIFEKITSSTIQNRKHPSTKIFLFPVSHLRDNNTPKKRWQSYPNHDNALPFHNATLPWNPIAFLQAPTKNPPIRRKTRSYSNRRHFSPGNPQMARKLGQKILTRYGFFISLCATALVTFGQSREQAPSAGDNFPEAGNRCSILN